MLSESIVAAITRFNLLAQEKAVLQPNATVLSLLQGSSGKAVELHLRSGEKMGGKLAGVTDNVVHLSNLTVAEFFDAFIDAKDISAVVVRVAGKIVVRYRHLESKISVPKIRLTKSLEDCQAEAQLSILAT